MGVLLSIKKEVWFFCLAQPPAPCEEDPFEAFVAFSFRKQLVNNAEALWPLLTARTDRHVLFSNPWTWVFCFGNRYAVGQLLQDKHTLWPVYTKTPMGTILFLLAFTTEGLSVFVINLLAISLNTVLVLYVLLGLLCPGTSCALQPCISWKRSNLWVAEVWCSRHWGCVEKAVG